MAIVNNLRVKKVGDRNVAQSVVHAATDTAPGEYMAVNGTTAVLTAAQNGPIGGKIYTASCRVISTNNSVTITPMLYGSLDGTNYFKLSDLEGSDLTTNRTVSSASATSVIGVFDLRNYAHIPYWKLAVVGSNTCTAKVKLAMVL